MATRDYYGVLGVPRDASIEDIRRAYRAIARQCHPDRAGDNPVASARFEESTEAYHVLSDLIRRRKYDRGFEEVKSVPDLLGRHLLGRRVLEFMIPRASAEPEPGMDFMRVCRVAPTLMREGGTMSIRIGDQEMALDVPLGPVATRWCRLVGLGEPGRNNGMPGDLWIVVLPDNR